MKSTSSAHMFWWVIAFVSLLALSLSGCSNKSTTDEQDLDPPTAGTTGDSDTSSGSGLALDDAVEAAESRDDRAELLVQRFVVMGRRNVERGNLEEALENFSEALDLDPNNADAQSGYNEVSGLLGRTPGSAGLALEQGVDRKTLQVQEARIRADRSFKRGKYAFENEDYETAIQDFEDALAILNWFPYDLDTRFDRGLVKDYLTRAEESLSSQKKAREEALAAAVEAEKAAEAERAQANMSERISKLFADADRQFTRGNFEVSAQLAQAILDLDGSSNEAKSLYELSMAAYHAQRDEVLLKDYSENWRTVFEELKGSMVPQNGIVEFPKGWAENQALRQPRQFTNEDTTESAEETRIRNLLAEIKFSPAFEDEPLQDVMDFFHDISGVNFVVTRQVTEELSDSELAVNLEVTDLSMEKALNLITGLKNLVWRVEDSVVKLTTAQDVTGDVYLELYNVRDLTTPIIDYPGEEIVLEGSSGFESFDDSFEELEEPEPAIAADRLVQLIQDNIATDSWEPPTSIESREGVLVIMQTREVHRMIREMLDDLRGSQGLLVHIEARFLTVEDNFLEDVGVDFRGLGDDTGGGGTPGKGTNEPLDDILVGTPAVPEGGGTDNSSGIFYNDGQDGDVRGRVENLIDETLGEDGVMTGSGGFTGQFTYLDDTELEAILRAVQKSERINAINAPTLLIANNERASISVINQVSYIKDFDVEIAQAAQIADPIVDVISDGVILDVRPVVSADRRFVTLELRPTVSQLERPIPERDVSFAIGNAGRLQLPRLEVQRVRTTVTVPDGGTLLLGGLKIAEERNTKSGVPILSDIPIVSFFFTRRGTFNRYKNLLVLLKARVVIMNEFEPGVGIGR